VTTRQKWPEVEAALDTILSLPERDWHAASLRLAGDDAELCRELLSLLACVGGFDPLLDRPATYASAASPQDSASLTTGTRLGAYRILNLIGRGGMGEVYLAERADGQFEQRTSIASRRSVRFWRVSSTRASRICSTPE
jgi:eukaryotic-like serine/threonine-protein kinase